MSILFSPVFYPIKELKQKYFFYLTLFTFVQFLGLGNELFEYSFRPQASDYYSKLAYQDTIIDFIMNIFGAGLGMVFLSWSRKPIK